MNVSVVGLGKLGLPLAAVIASSGHYVVGVDNNSDVVDTVNRNESPVAETGLPQLIAAATTLTTTTSYELAISQTDITLVIVPTPSHPDGTFSNDYVLEAIHHIGHALRAKNTYHLVVLNSTVMPGSCDGEIRAELEKSSHRTVGKSLGFCYSPEFIALGSVIHDIRYPDMVLIGESDFSAGNYFQKLWKTVLHKKSTFVRLSLINAEIAKLAVNMYVTTKISFANVLAEVCENYPNADAHQVAKAIGLDSRIGVKYLEPATAYGGPCFPRDARAFAHLGSPLLSATVDMINQSQVQRLVQKVIYHEPERVGILGLTYKPYTHITDESVGIALAYQLESEFQVVGYDPGVAEVENITTMNSAKECIETSDLIVIATPWPDFVEEDYADKRVIDCWGLLASKNLPNYERIGRG